MVVELAAVLSYRSAAESAGSSDGGVVSDEPSVVVCATPEVALRSAREVLERMSDAQIGIHVGELEGTTGPTVEVACRIAAMAAPGAILVSDVARLLLGRGGVFEPAGTLATDDDRQIRVHRLGGQRERTPRPTVGRDVELASIDWLIEELTEGNGRVLVFEGEAGIGKSHLAAVVADRSAAIGARVVRAEGDELQQDRPGLLLGRLLTQLDDDVDTAAPHPGWVNRFTAAVERAAIDRPLVLIVEDLHWADPLSLRALGSVARVIGPLPVALVADHRPAPRPALLGPLLDVLDRAGAERHVLEPLDAEATSSLVAALLGGAPGAGLRERLVATAGNPLFVTELLRSLAADESLHHDGGIVDTDRVGIPDRLVETVLRRLDTLPGTTVDLVRDASILGSAFTLADLSTVTGADGAEIIASLEPALETRVLEASDRGIAFRHDLVRDAVYGSMPEAVRASKHASAGWALADAGAPAIVVAGQLAMGDDADGEPALAWIATAATQARDADPASAVRLYELLLDRAPAAWSGRELAETALVEMLAATGRVDEAIDRAERLMARHLDPASERLLRDGVIAALASKGDLAAAAAVADEAIAASNDPRDRSLLECVAASMRIFVGGGAAAVSDAADALSAIDDDEAGAWAQQALGLVDMVEGRYERSLDHMVESRRLLDRSPIVDRGFLIPHVHVPTMFAYIDHFDGQLDDVREGAQRWEARGEISRMIFGHVGMANGAYLTGQYDIATAEAESGLALADETGASAMAISFHAILGLVSVDVGDFDRTARHVDEGLEIFLGGAHRFGLDMLMLARARILERRGDPAAAASVLDQLWAEVGDLALAVQYRDVVPDLVRLADHGVDPRRVSDAITAAERAAERTPIHSTIGCALRVRGIADADPDLLVRAVDEYRHSPRVVERARTMEDAAAALFARDRIDEGAAMTDEATALFEAAGAPGCVARVDAMAREHGVRRRRSGPAQATSGWGALTPKELEVVDMVAEGLSNPEIGERLYISRRTVESHLSHVYSKLGVPNRAKLTAVVVERRTSS